MKAKNKIITAVLLSAGAAVGTALINKYIKMSAVARNLLTQPEPRCYRWRLGNIYYTKTGTGKPLLLVHDLTHASSSCEWDSLIPLLKEYYTVYTIDLLGCGRSEKPNLTYTNFLYVQLLNDFIKSEIGRRTNIVATGASAPIATMACGYNPDLFEQMMFINPDSLLSCSHIPGKSAKCYKFILDLPIIGTLLYNFASARSIISKTFSESYFYNPYDVNPHNIDIFLSLKIQRKSAQPCRCSSTSFTQPYFNVSRETFPLSTKRRRCSLLAATPDLFLSLSNNLSISVLL